MPLQNGLEVSRLARSSSDWHRLLEICTTTDTLLLGEDGFYNAGDFNDRVVLGLKGTMSEAELHLLRARLRGGLLNKARRGDLKTPLPAGFVYAPDGRVVLDPDQQVQDTVRLLCHVFRRTGSAGQTVREFRRRGDRLPAAHARGSAERRVDLGAADARHRGGRVAQPALCRSVLLRAPARASCPRSRTARGEPAPGAMGGLLTRSAPRLHLVGGTRREPPALGGQRTGRAYRHAPRG